MTSIKLFYLSYNNNGNLPTKGGLLVLREFIVLIVTPTLVGIATKLFAYWVDKQDDFFGF